MSVKRIKLQITAEYPVEDPRSVTELFNSFRALITGAVNTDAGTVTQVVGLEIVDESQELPPVDQPGETPPTDGG